MPQIHFVRTDKLEIIRIRLARQFLFEDKDHPSYNQRPSVTKAANDRSTHTIRRGIV
ncbi:MAG: hypothetical protein QXN55_09020 [Candidatus Nitrosotenuis sp.]